MWDECQFMMDTKDELAAHFDVHLDRYVKGRSKEEDNDPFPCPVNACLHIADAAVDLKRHLAMHQFHAHAQFVGLLVIVAKDQFRDLHRCGFPPSLDIAYSGEMTYCLWDKCHDCFDDPLDLFNHVMVHIDFLSSDDKICDEESALPQHRCLWEHCYRQFESKGDLRKHVRHHSGEKYCACPFCGRFFSRPDKLYEHLLRKQVPDPNDSENNGVCLLCQRRFADERSLVNHVRRHINGRQCPTCGLAVQLPSDLHRHILVKHTERVKTMACPQCDKSFYCASDLIRHSAIHAPPTEQCPSCGERFRWKKQLNKHLASHSKSTPARPYLCHICDSTYVTGHGLTRHLSRKHDCPIPEGFSRFSYKKCADGCYRLQTRKLIRTVLYE